MRKIAICALLLCCLLAGCAASPVKTLEAAADADLEIKRYESHLQLDTVVDGEHALADKLLSVWEDEAKAHMVFTTQSALGEVVLESYIVYEEGQWRRYEPQGEGWQAETVDRREWDGLLAQGGLYHCIADHMGGIDSVTRYPNEMLDGKETGRLDIELSGLALKAGVVQLLMIATGQEVDVGEEIDVPVMVSLWVDPARGYTRQAAADIAQLLQNAWDENCAETFGSKKFESAQLRLYVAKVDAIGEMETPYR